MLGLASSGNMVSDFKWIFGILAGTIFAILIVKIAFGARNFREDLKNPAVCGIACTLPMAVTVLSTYINPFLPDVAFAVFIAAIASHVLLLVYFTINFMIKPDVKKFLPCYFIPYVGIAIGAVVAPVYGVAQLGQALFWFGFASYLVLLPLILYRVAVVKAMPEPVVPTITIFAAPASLCLVGYLKSFNSADLIIVSLLFGLSIASYFAVLALMPRMLRLKFYPSYSAFTFPLVISAIAASGTHAYLLKQNIELVALQYLSYVEIALAVIMVSYVLVRYTHHFLPRGKAKQA